MMSNPATSATPDRGSVYVSIDLETTGFSFINNEIIQIGAVAFDDDLAECGHFEVLVKPSGRLPSKITQLTGITEAAITTAGLEPKVAWQRWRTFLLGLKRSVVFVGYNVIKFDLPFMIMLGLRVEQRFDALPFLGVVDYLTVLRTLQRGGAPLPRSLKLGQVYRFFVGEELTEAHSALADARAVLTLLRHPREFTQQLCQLVPVARESYMAEFHERYERLGLNKGRLRHARADESRYFPYRKV